MKLKWNPNWLVFFTVALFVTALTMFVATFRDQFGLKTCVYGDSEYTAGQAIPDEPRCFCNEKGSVVCKEIEIDSTLEVFEYVNEDLEFSSSFLNFIEVAINFESIRFGEVTTVEKGLKIVVERLSMCNENEQLPPQVGYYMFDGEQLHLTTSTNLLAGNYGKVCMVSNTFMVHGLGGVSKILYHSEDNRVIEADICVLDGKVYSAGDAFVNESGEVVVCE